LSVMSGTDVVLNLSWVCAYRVTTLLSLVEAVAWLWRQSGTRPRTHSTGTGWRSDLVRTLDQSVQRAHGFVCRLVQWPCHEIRCGTVLETIWKTVPGLISGPSAIQDKSDCQIGPGKFQIRSAGRLERIGKIIIAIVRHIFRNLLQDSRQSWMRSNRNNSSLFIMKEKISPSLGNFIPPHSGATAAPNRIAIRSGFVARTGGATDGRLFAWTRTILSVRPPVGLHPAATVMASGDASSARPGTRIAAAMHPDYTRGFARLTVEIGPSSCHLKARTRKHLGLELCAVIEDHLFV